MISGLSAALLVSEKLDWAARGAMSSLTLYRRGDDSTADGRARPEAGGPRSSDHVSPAGLQFGSPVRPPFVALASVAGWQIDRRGVRGFAAACRSCTI